MKTNQVYLIHIRDCLARIDDYTKEGKEFFLKDLKTQDAVIRNLEVMAESIVIKIRGLIGWGKFQYIGKLKS